MKICGYIVRFPGFHREERRPHVHTTYPLLSKYSCHAGSGDADEGPGVAVGCTGVGVDIRSIEARVKLRCSSGGGSDTTRRGARAAKGRMNMW